MLAACFDAWSHGEDGQDADAGKVIAARFVIAVLDALGEK